MSKNLFKLYIFFIIAFLIFINIFYGIFININNTIEYILDKTIVSIKENRDNTVNIYDDKANVIIMLDDGWKTQYTIAYNYMHQKKMRGSIAIISSLIGTNKYMSKGNLYEIYDDNWDLLNHSYSHLILPENNIDKQTIEINKVDKWLNKNGFVSPYKILIYPEGKYNSETIVAMRSLNYISGRSIEEGYNVKLPNDLYDIKVRNVLSNISPNEVKTWIDYAIDNNLTVILLFHKLEDNVDQTLMKYKVKDFYKIIDYIDNRRDDLNIITYSDWIQYIIHNARNP